MASCRIQPLRKKVTIATVVANVGSASATAILWWKTPSPRLHCSIAIVASANPGQTPGFDATSTWTLTPYIEGREPMAIKDVVVNQSLPDGYEAVSATRLWRVRLPSLKAAATDWTGEIVAIATWEPAAGYNPTREEIDELYALCDLVLEGQPLALAS